MYEEGNKKLSFNWGSLAIKLAILAVVVFIVCLIVTRFTGGSNSSAKTLAVNNSEYITNITAMKDAAFEYFTPSKLPEKVGSTEKLTLSQMLNQKLLIDFTEDGDVCDINSSYVQTTKTADGNYALKVSLDCGEKSDFIVTTIEENNCTNGICNNSQTNTDVVIDETPIDTNPPSSNNNTNTNTNSNSNTNTSTNTTTNGNSSTTTTTTGSSTGSKVTTTVKTTVNIKITCSSLGCCYNNCNTNTGNTDKPEDKPSTPEEPTTETVRKYEYVRWSDWKEGYSSNPNDQVSKKTTTTYSYCKDTTKTYYTTGYVTDTTPYNSHIGYELQILDIDPDEIEGSVAIVNSSKSYFSNSLTDYRNYINNRGNMEMTGGNDKYSVRPLTDYSRFRESSLDKDNFTFEISGVYKKGGVYRVYIDEYYKNHNGVTPYYADNLGFNVYFVPVKFDLSFAYKDDCVRDLASNQDKYDGYSVSNKKTETVWYHRSREYTWSTEKSLPGWEWTGNYKDEVVNK